MGFRCNVMTLRLQGPFGSNVQLNSTSVPNRFVEVLGGIPYLLNVGSPTLVKDREVPVGATSRDGMRRVRRTRTLAGWNPIFPDRRTGLSPVDTSWWAGFQGHGNVQVDFEG